MPEVICPQCQNPIYDEEALSCHFCGSSLSRASSGFLGALRGGSLKWILMVVAVMIIAVMIMSF